MFFHHHSNRYQGNQTAVFFLLLGSHGPSSCQLSSRSVQNWGKNNVPHGMFRTPTQYVYDLYLLWQAKMMTKNRSQRKRKLRWKWKMTGYPRENGTRSLRLGRENWDTGINSQSKNLNTFMFHQTRVCKEWKTCWKKKVFEKVVFSYL